MINFSGKCKIWNHSYSDHKIGKFIFNQTEENEQLINSEIEEIKNYIKTLSETRKSKTSDLNKINISIECNKEILNRCNKQANNCDKEIMKIEKENSLIENEIIKTLDNIKKILIF